MEGAKSSDSDDEVKSSGLDFVAMSLCGGLETGGPTNEEFNQHLIKYSEVCENPAIFSLPNLVVRLNGKFYSWGAACPIVMTMITFQKPLPRVSFNSSSVLSNFLLTKRFIRRKLLMS